MVLYFINSLFIFNGEPAMLSKLEMRDLAQSMLCLNIPKDKLKSTNREKVLGNTTKIISENSIEILNPPIDTELRTATVVLTDVVDLSLSRNNHKSKSSQYVKEMNDIQQLKPEQIRVIREDHIYSRSNKSLSRSSAKQRNESPELSAKTK